MKIFLKGYIVKVPVFPESINCKECGKNLDTKLKVECEICKTLNNISNLMPKPRSVILWIEKVKWSDGITFGIPLSADFRGYNFDDKYNQLIEIGNYDLVNNSEIKKPLRAAINQSTRIDGNAIINSGVVRGMITDEVLMDRIELKLKKWLGFLNP